jgi:hypothetical protein
MIPNKNEILERCYRLVRQVYVDPPELTAETELASLSYNKDKLPHQNFRKSKKPSVYWFLYNINDEFDSPHWNLPEYFDWEKTYKKIKTINDLVKLVIDGYEEQQACDEKQKTDEQQKNDLKLKLKGVKEIDCCELLENDNLPWEQVQKYFLESDWDDEEYLVEAIKLHLRTPQQKKILDSMDLSIYDILNGRYGDVAGQDKKIEKIYQEWNDKLGFKNFGND